MVQLHRVALDTLRTKELKSANIYEQSAPMDRREMAKEWIKKKK